MPSTKADIIAKLQKEILPLQGYKPAAGAGAIDFGLGPIRYSFPNHSFPLGAMHEFVYTQPEQGSATSGFIAGILSSLMRRGGVSLWISTSRLLFPPALKAFGINPEKIIFIDLQREKDIIWAMEEALKCESLSCVVGEMPELDFTISRRLQLVVEKSRVTGFIIRKNPKRLNTTACITRWMITSLPSVLPDEMPGVGFPRWNIDLVKVRNGKPGSWQLEWAVSRFRHLQKININTTEEQKNVG